MPRFEVEFHHNVSCILGGDLSIFNRMGQPIVQPGDTFTYVCTIEFEAPTSDAVRVLAFAAGNLVHVAGGAEYDRYADRSMCAGDVLVIHTPDGPEITYADAAGWVDITEINDYWITPGEPSYV